MLGWAVLIVGSVWVCGGCWAVLSANSGHLGSAKVCGGGTACESPHQLAHSLCGSPIVHTNIIINIIISLNSGTPKSSNSESTVKPTVLELIKKELLIF